MSEEQHINQPQVQKEQSAKAIRLARQRPALSSYTSYWPLALAVSLCVVLFGIILNPIVSGIGVVLTVAAVIAWGLERR